MARRSLAARITAQTGQHPPAQGPAGRDELVSPAAFAEKLTVRQRPWQGRLAKKPWSYRVTAVVPHCNTPDLLRLCLAFLRVQTVRPYIVVVDTGSQQRLLPELLAMRGEDCEVQQVACHGVERSADLPAIAMEVGQACVRSPWMLSVHSDCLVTDRTLIERWIDQAESQVTGEGLVPAIGYQSIPRVGCDWWRGMLSHTLTLLHMPTCDRADVAWSLRRLVNKYSHDWSDLDRVTRCDTEVLLNCQLDAAGVPKIIVGEESWGETERDDNRVHLRSYTAHAIGRRVPERFARDLPGLLEGLVALAASYGQPLPDDCARRLVSLEQFPREDVPWRESLGLAMPPGWHDAAIASGLDPHKILQDSMPVQGKTAQGKTAQHVLARPQGAVQQAGIVEPATGSNLALAGRDCWEKATGHTGMPVVTFIAPVFEYFPVLLPSLMDQSYQNWRLLLYHDGPPPEWLKQKLAAIGDGRSMLLWTERRHDDFGHTLRELGINRLAKGFVGDWVVLTNGDNYYVPGFLQAMLGAAERQPDCQTVVCETMAHNYWGWRPIRCVPELGEIDCGAVMVRREALLEIGFPWRGHAADYQAIGELVRRYGLGSIARAPGVLFIHN